MPSCKIYFSAIMCANLYRHHISLYYRPITYYWFSEDIKSPSLFPMVDTSEFMLLHSSRDYYTGLHFIHNHVEPTTPIASLVLFILKRWHINHILHGSVAPYLEVQCHSNIIYLTLCISHISIRQNLQDQISTQLQNLSFKRCDPSRLDVVRHSEFVLWLAS